MKKKTTYDILKKLVDERKMTKYRIAKLTGVHWNTVQLWYRNVFKPNDIHSREIEKIYESNKEKVN